MLIRALVCGPRVHSSMIGEGGGVRPRPGHAGPAACGAARVAGRSRAGVGRPPLPAGQSAGRNGSTCLNSPAISASTSRPPKARTDRTRTSAWRRSIIGDETGPPVGPGVSRTATARWRPTVAAEVPANVWHAVSAAGTFRPARVRDQPGHDAFGGRGAFANAGAPDTAEARRQGEM